MPVRVRRVAPFPSYLSTSQLHCFQLSIYPYLMYNYTCGLLGGGIRRLGAVSR